jgi:acyl-CoA thioesterase FadM
MSFSVSFPTRHTDTYASTGFVHAGVLLALTELAYAEFERHCGVSKPEQVVAVQQETHAVYRAPLRWQEGVTIEVTTTEANERGFTQQFIVTSAVTGSAAGTFVHRWVWLDVNTGRRVDLPVDVQRRFLAGLGERAAGGRRAGRG